MSSRMGSGRLRLPRRRGHQARCACGRGRECRWLACHQLVGATYKKPSMYSWDAPQNATPDSQANAAHPPRAPTRINPRPAGAQAQHEQPHRPRTRQGISMAWATHAHPQPRPSRQQPNLYNSTSNEAGKEHRVVEHRVQPEHRHLGEEFRIGR